MVKAWNEKVVIPTYQIGKPEKNPIFLEKRVYQGSSGVVYPYPVIESISDTKTDITYNAVFIENEYLKIMVLPELGGRIQMAYDKIKQRHFVYYNHVIKPALVGLTGPWISGGIEFNWPQHHRPSTFLPVDWKIENNSDGSVTVWVNERERMFHQKGMAGFTLRPGTAYLEIKGVLYNPTELPQTFLWWANPAVAVNDHYRSVFPPDIHAVFDHGKRAVSSFPIATGTYYKMDYSAGVDISNYKNIKVPTSYMGVNSRYDFEGGYEDDTHGGMLHVASHHVSPGKKQWTWGNGDFGRAWDRNLTDDDGPYIELMAGVYTENQPDFSWIQPYEEKMFTQYFLPYRELGIVKNANKDFLVNLENCEDNIVNIKLFATSAKSVEVQLLSDKSGEIIFSEKVSVDPENIYTENVKIPDIPLNEITLNIIENGRIVLTWHSESDEIPTVPGPAEAPLSPVDIKTNEQLYLTGLHLEQYRHATWSPLDYYMEALRRDPNDIRCNNAMGLWYIRKGRFDLAVPYLQTALKAQRKRNPNPYDGEPAYNLGIALKFLGKNEEAYANLYKSTWNGAWQDAGFMTCAQISIAVERYEEALDEIDKSLFRNWHNSKARTIKATLLRKQNKDDEALRLIEESLSIDPFNYGCMYEKYLITGNHEDLSSLKYLMRNECHNYDETALDYLAAGCYDESISLWKVAIDHGATSPMTYYYSGYAYWLKGDKDAANKLFKTAAEIPSDYCFPNRLDAILALEKAIELNNDDAKAPYYLGCLYYDKRQYDLAIELWKRSAEIDETFPTVWRNLALAVFNKNNDATHALEFMTKAFELDITDSRVLMELDQLRKRLRHSHTERLEFLNQYPELIAKRDDLILELATLLNMTGKYHEAIKVIDSHKFHPWEGGEGKVSAQYQFARVELAKIAIKESRYDEAIALLNECLIYPEHLGEGKLHGAQENDFLYLLGMAYKELGDEHKASQYFEKATEGPEEPAAALYYNDAKPDKIFYAALAYRAIGNENKARALFNKLINYGRNHIHDNVTLDYFAVSLPDLLIWEDDLQHRNLIHCNYLLALGYAGLGDLKRAEKHISVAEADINHIGIKAFKSMEL